MKEKFSATRMEVDVGVCVWGEGGCKVVTENVCNSSTFFRIALSLRSVQLFQGQKRKANKNIVVEESLKR